MKKLSEKEVSEIIKKGLEVKDYEEDIFFEVDTGIYESGVLLTETGVIRKIVEKGKCKDIFADQISNEVSETIIDDEELITKQFGIDQNSMTEKDIEKIIKLLGEYEVEKHWEDDNYFYVLETKYINNTTISKKIIVKSKENGKEEEYCILKDYTQKELWEIMKRGENAKDYKENMFFNIDEAFFEENEPVIEVESAGLEIKEVKDGKELDIIEKEQLEDIKEKLKTYKIIREWQEESTIYEIETEYKNNEIREQKIRIINKNNTEDKRTYSMYFKNI